VYASKEASNQSNTSLFSHLLVFLVLLSCFARLCCFEERSIRVKLMRQGSTKFHVSHQSFCVNIFLATQLGTTFTCLSLLQVSLSNR
jgi:hypothetical protein